MGWKKIKRLILFFMAVAVFYQAGRQFFLEEEWAARNYLHEQVKSAFPDAMEHAARGYGLSRWKSGKRLKGAALMPGESDLPVVVLIHGLDEPGRIWMDLAPVLDEKGNAVLMMSYPNDQRITASARLFFEALKGLPRPHGRELVIIGHSMGGLVSREMLTSPEIGYARAQAGGLVPPVSDLIMVGTPNHGSQLARFRFFMEFREQFLNFFEEDTTLLQGMLDGTGAAGLDLIPGSVFLNRLNSRPHPTGVNLHVIAGGLSPWTSRDIRELARRMETLLPFEKQQAARSLEAALTEMGNTLGDGLVTIDSAILENIASTRVQGSHLTMIRNFTQGSGRVPPAIPVILKILGDKLK
ncbi:MAG: alpha/beta fold hydrolase [Desulfobacter sp.]|nr:MAG: alpha/beta fold hydrolase [Desulfobacter sp.]